MGDVDRHPMRRAFRGAAKGVLSACFLLSLALLAQSLFSTDGLSGFIGAVWFLALASLFVSVVAIPVAALVGYFLIENELSHPIASISAGVAVAIPVVVASLWVSIGAGGVVSSLFAEAPLLAMLALAAGGIAGWRAHKDWFV